MEESPEREKMPRDIGGNIVSKFFGILMVVLYLVLGTTIIFRAPSMRNVPEPLARGFGVLLILYGFYRGYKLYRKYF